jgi:hypothetical protein
MAVATARAGDDGASPADSILAAGDLEVPRPLRLLLTAAWSLTESAGLPVAAYVLAARADGRGAGTIAALVAIWLTVVIRRVATGSVPSILVISALVLTVQAAVVLATGELATTPGCTASSRGNMAVGGDLLAAHGRPRRHRRVRTVVLRGAA